MKIAFQKVSNAIRGGKESVRQKTYLFLQQPSKYAAEFILRRRTNLRLPGGNFFFQPGDQGKNFVIIGGSGP